MTHRHSDLWAMSSPRTEVVADDEKALGAVSRGDPLLEPDVVSQLADYFGQYISEIRRSKPLDGQEGRVSAMRPNNPQAARVRDSCASEWAELRRLLEPSGADSGAAFDRGGSG